MAQQGFLPTSAGLFHSVDNPPRFHSRHIRSSQRPRAIPTHISKIVKKKLNARNPGQYLSIGHRIQELFWSALQLDHAEDHWSFGSVLGYGSFGIAALYQNTATRQKIAVKSELPVTSMAVNAQRVDISKEAYHQVQMNERGCVHNTAIYSFKYICGDESLHYNRPYAARVGEQFNAPYYREWRSYLEYCDLGTLLPILMKYKAWGYHLPEAFIWWVAYGLIQSCQSMERAPFRHDGNHDPGRFGWPMPNSFMLHNDIKEENTFVKQSTPTNLPAPYLWYPMVKMGDFGLSTTTSKQDPSNTSEKLPYGTPMYVPPEKRVPNPVSSFYPYDNPQNPVQRTGNMTLGNKRAHPVGPESNVWAVGLMVLLLMTLLDSEEADMIIDRQIGAYEENPPPLGEHLYLLSADIFPSVETDVSDDYSQSLKNLVLECTRIEPSRRPTANFLAEYIRRNLVSEANRLTAEFDGKAEDIQANTLLITENGMWNLTQPGPFWERLGVSLTPVPSTPIDEGMRDMFWSDFWKYCETFKSPDEATLLPPTATRWVQHPSPQYHGTETFQDDYTIRAPAQYYVNEGFHQQFRPTPGGRAIDPKKRQQRTMIVQHQQARDLLNDLAYGSGAQTQLQQNTDAQSALRRIAYGSSPPPPQTSPPPQPPLPPMTPPQMGAHRDGRPLQPVVQRVEGEGEVQGGMHASPLLQQQVQQQRQYNRERPRNVVGHIEVIDLKEEDAPFSLFGGS